MRRLAAAASLLALAAAAGASSAGAHSGGKAQPRVTASLAGSGLVRTLSVRLVDVDGREPIEGAQVAAGLVMRSPHVMRLVPQRLREARPGTYRARLRFLMPARWRVEIDVSGPSVRTAQASLDVSLEGGAGSTPSGGAPGVVLPTEIDDSLARSDAVSILVLWLHALAAGTWMIGVVAMVVALGTRPGVLAPTVRGRIARAYRRWGVWAHWSLVPVVVATGVYNMLKVTPFSLVWRPGELAALADIPYGGLYEAILVVKLALFAALFVAGTNLLVRTVRGQPSNVVAVPGESSGFAHTLLSALGPAGVLYLACIPLILLAAAALRYVHVLNHVAIAAAPG